MALPASILRLYGAEEAPFQLPFNVEVIPDLPEPLYEARGLCVGCELKL
jgi:hypothetical protein